MAEPEINIRTDPRPTARASGRAKRPLTSPVVLLASAAVCAAIAIVILVAVNSSWPNIAAPAKPDTSSNRPDHASAMPAAPEGGESPSGEEIVDDPQGKLLWASPTASAPLSLAYVPSGTQCLLHLRPAELVAHPEGERTLAALGPWGRQTVVRLKSIVPAELSEIDSLLAAFVIRDDGALDACLRVALASPLAEDELATRLAQAEQRRHDGASYYVVDDRAYFLAAQTAPGDVSTDWLIVCPAALAEGLIDSAGEPPPLVRDIERLAESADADRLFTAIVAPKFLQAGGNELLAEQAAPLHDALHWLVGNDATAILVSAHLAEDFFAEVRTTPNLNVPPRRLALALGEKIAAAPEAVEEMVLAEPWHPYGRKVIARLPGMLRALARYSRVGEDRRQAVVRAYLPATAGHNLLLAAELLLTQPRAGEAAAASRADNTEHSASIEERLNRRTSLSFTKETLERALEMLAEDIGVEISINGADLQLEGITKNQSLALELRDRPAGEILLEILLRANPDRTATGPGDPKQKLIYLLEGGDSNSPGRIIVTTRAAAERRGDSVPAVFLPNNR